MESTYVRRITRQEEALPFVTANTEVLSKCTAVTLPALPRGCRKITMRSRFSARGYIVADLPSLPGQAQRIGYESLLERSFVLLMLARSDVIDLVEQPFTIKYKDDQGRSRRYTLDYLVVLANGSRLAVEVKASRRALEKTVRERLQEVKLHLSAELADDVYLFTDDDFEPWMAVNAGQLLFCRKFADPSSDVLIASLIANLNGETTIRDLVKMSGIGQRGYMAAVRAIYSGQLLTVKKGIFGPRTTVVKEVQK